MTQLIRRVAKVTVGSHVFAFPPLDIDIDRTQSLNKFGITTVTLYNPNDDMVGQCQSRKTKSGKVIRPLIIVDAGYGKNVSVGNTEIVSEGDVHSYEHRRNGADRELEINITDQGRFRPDVRNRAIKQPNKASVILRFISAGFNTNIRVGEEAYLDRFVIRNEISAIKELVKKTKSAFFFRNGKLNVIPAKLTPKNPTFVSEASGLLDTPRKIETSKEEELGYTVKTLFTPGVGVGSSISFRIESENRSVAGVIYESRLSFSTFGDSSVTHKVATDRTDKREVA